MKISYNWIRELAPVEWSPEEMAERLTACGTACENIVDHAARFRNFVVGKVLEVNPVQGADKLRQTTVNVGKSKLSILCGAPNVAEGQIVPVAMIGATMPNGLVISKIKKFGVESEGMIASEAELELSDDHSGIMVLPENLKAGTPLADALGLNDYTLEFELTPDRADSMCAIGIARDVAALAGIKLKRPAVKYQESKSKSSSAIKVTIDDPEFCPRYIAKVVKNVTIGPSPDWMRNRLLDSGVSSINNVVDITNYVMLETGQPLHAFDFAHFRTGKVVVRRAKKGSFVTLDEIKRDIDNSVLMITNGEEDLATGGVMGGLKSSITDSTKDVLLEAACFDPSLLRKSRKKLGLVTDASQRFEKGVDPNGTQYAIDRAAQLLVEYANGEALSGSVDNYARKIKPLKLKLRQERVGQILGDTIPRKKITTILKSLEIPATDSGKGPMSVTAPTFRPDIAREIDLIEEVARIYGLDNLPTHQNYLRLYPSDVTARRNSNERLLESIRQALFGSGFDEICGSGFADGKNLDQIAPGYKPVYLANPISDDLSALRPTLLHSLLSAARANLTHEIPAVRIFELGNVYGPKLGGKFHEKRHLGLLATGEKTPFWRGNGTSNDLYSIKGALANVANQANLLAVEMAQSDDLVFVPGAGFDLKLSGKSIGTAGQIKPDILKLYDIKQPIFVAEMDFEALLAAQADQRAYVSMPKFPSSTRDLSMIVDEATLAEDILGSIRKQDPSLIEEVLIFDVFRGKQVPEGKKSLALSIRFRATERSLKSSEVDSLQAKIIAYLKDQFKAEIRDQ